MYPRFFSLRTFHRVALLSIFLWTLTACTNSSTTPIPEIKTSIQLSWLHNIEFVGFYVAAERGYYADQKLTVDIRSAAKGDAIVDQVQEVLSGNADFGIVDATVLLEARAEGKPLVAIGTIYQRHPMALASLAKLNITTPKDLIGKKIQISQPSRVLIKAFLNSQKIDLSQVTLVDRNDYSLKPLTSGEADLIDAWAINEIVSLKAQGIAYNAIFPSDYGIDYYPDVIFATEDTIAKKPDLVKRFLTAIVRGMQTAVDDPGQAAKISAKYDTQESLPAQELAMNQSLALLAPSKAKPAMMQAALWTSTYQLLKDQGLLSKDIDVGKAYTLTFLDQIYSK